MIATSLLLLLPAPALQDSPAPIRVEDYRSHVVWLADDAREGRESGKEGGHAAARYVAAHFKKLGLKPMGQDGSYLVPFQVGQLECFNTAALLAGTDPALAGEMLVIGAHHDHAGIGGPGAMGSPGQIHNGADDNASGTAGVLELAEYFVAHPTRRPILFLTFSAEERGLLGSAAFVKDGPVPVSSMRAMINLDMIGRSRNDYVFLGGLGTALEFHELLDPLIAKSGLDVEPADAGEAPSDNTSFYRAGIPVLFFFTHIHEDYHLPGDDAEKINAEGAVKILSLVREVVVRLNDGNDPLSFEEAPGMAMPADFYDRMNQHYRQAAELRRQRGRLGFVPGDPAGGGIEVASVREGSAAHSAGLRAGDILLAVSKEKVADMGSLRRALGGKLKGDAVTLSVVREGREMTLKATLE